MNQISQTNESRVHGAQMTGPQMNGVGSVNGLDDHIYQRLLRERIIFLGSEVRDQNANAICAQLLLLSAEDPTADIFLHIKKVLFELIAHHTGQGLEQVERDADRDRWFTAEQAKEYGFIDHVITSAREAADEGRPARNKD